MRSLRDPVDEWLIATVGAAADPLVTLLDKLTDQQFQFCQEYIRCGSPTKAAKNIQMPSGTNPHMLIHLPKIAACINILTARREAELGQKSAAEIVERLHNTPVVEAEDFDFAEPSLKEREAKLAQPAIQGASDNELRENMAAAAGADNGIMQLPKVRVSQAQSYGPQWIIERFVTVAERCLQIEPVYDRKGRPIGQFKFEPNAALKALEMLGKTMAMFHDRVAVTHELAHFSESEIDTRLQALSAMFPEFKAAIEGESKKVAASAD